MEYKDYYETLGVERSAGKDEIQKAYRKLARKYHPDVSKVEDAETRFKEINEAYEVLKDPEKRKKYDQFGSAWKQARQSGSPPPGWEGIPFDFSQFSGQGGRQGGGFHFEGGPGSGFSDFFEMLFGGAAGGAGAGFGGGRGRRPAARKGADQETTITLSLEEAARGGQREIALTDGSGQTKTLSVKIPPGVKPGGRIRLSGQGAAGAGGGPAGDLYLKVELVPHPALRLQGTDLHTTVPIAPWEAALGGQATVPTLNGAETIKIPAGTSSGRKVRLRGKGFPRPKDGAGDLYAEFRIVVPEEPSAEERTLYEQLKEVSDFEPRS